MRLLAICINLRQTFRITRKNCDVSYTEVQGCQKDLVVAKRAVRGPTKSETRLNLIRCLVHSHLVLHRTPFSTKLKYSEVLVRFPRRRSPWLSLLYAHELAYFASQLNIAVIFNIGYGFNIGFIHFQQRHLSLLFKFIFMSIKLYSFNSLTCNFHAEKCATNI